MDQYERYLGASPTAPIPLRQYQAVAVADAGDVTALHKLALAWATVLTLRAMKRVALFAWLLATALVGAASGCGTDAIGIEACRSIEQARCAAAVGCGLSESEADCDQFVESNCLHGVALSTAPSQVDVDACADAIRAAGECGDDNGTGSDPCDCKALEPDSSAATVCDIVREPERARECKFLLPDPDAGRAPNVCPETADDGDPDASLEPVVGSDAG